jgi:hypothetical protein
MRFRRRVNISAVAGELPSKELSGRANDVGIVIVLELAALRIRYLRRHRQARETSSLRMPLGAIDGMVLRLTGPVASPHRHGLLVRTLCSIYSARMMGGLAATVSRQALAACPVAWAISAQQACVLCVTSTQA